MKPSISFTPRCAKISASASASAASSASGFSHRTDLPASPAFFAHSKCIEFGSGMYIASTESSAIRSS